MSNLNSLISVTIINLQILSFEEAGDEDESSLISTPIIKTMCTYSGYDPNKSRRTPSIRRMPSQEPRATRAMPIAMTKATTTPLVRHFFEHLFKNQVQMRFTA